MIGKKQVPLLVAGTVHLRLEKLKNWYFFPNETQVSQHGKKFISEEIH